MVYNKSYDAWYCTECYDMHRERAKELFQVIGKTKPQGSCHEDTVMHELLETFLDYEESHEIELKLVREGILIYLVRFHYPSNDSPSHASFAEIRSVLKRSEKPINHVLHSLEREGFLELEGSSDRPEARLTRQGVIEAKRVLSKVQGAGKDGPGYPIYPIYFPSTLEEFDFLFASRSDMLEYDNPHLFEKIVNDLKAEKVPKEEIKRRIDELKELCDY